MPNIVLQRAIKQDKLPDNGQWTNRFEVRSETSGRVYLVAQNIRKRHWACSCPGWKRHRKCKHLILLGIPTGKHLPAYEPGRLK